MQVSERVKGIAASQSLAMAARAKAMKAAGIDVISMSLGEPDMDTPEHIRRAAQEAIDNGWTHYGPVAGIASLREAIARQAYPQPLPKGKGVCTTHNTFAKVWGAHTANSAVYNLLEDSAREHRKNPTEAEAILWDMLKGNNIGLHFRRQHVILDYIVDFICVEKGLVIELDGGYHNTPEQREYDESRTAHLQQLGYAELRFVNEELLTNPNAVIKKIIETATNLPSLQGRIEDRPIVFEASDVIVSVGAKMAIYNAIQTVINPGDEVVIPMPSWVSYTEMVKLAGGKVVPVQTQYENRYCLTADELRAALTEKTRMLILCSPNNPTGSIYSHSQLEALVEVLREFPQVTVLSDEIYDALVYECLELSVESLEIASPSMALFPELAERLIIVNGVSKAYAMTGWRIGWLMSKNKAFIEACTRLQGQQVTCATMVAQKAAEAALTGSQDCVEAMRQVFAERRELICRLAAEIPGWKFEKPQGAFYLFPNISTLFGKFEIGDCKLEIDNADALAEYLLEEAHVAVVSGSAFGCPDCIRLSYAISTEEIIEAMRRIKSAIEKLK